MLFGLIHCYFTKFSWRGGGCDPAAYLLQTVQLVTVLWIVQLIRRTQCRPYYNSVFCTMHNSVGLQTTGPAAYLLYCISENLKQEWLLAFENVQIVCLCHNKSAFFWTLNVSGYYICSLYNPVCRTDHTPANVKKQHINPLCYRPYTPVCYRPYNPACYRPYNAI